MNKSHFFMSTITTSQVLSAIAKVKIIYPSRSIKVHSVSLDYGITGCGVFKAGIQNWKGFCIKINCSQMKLLNFENWTNGKPQ